MCCITAITADFTLECIYLNLVVWFQACFFNNISAWSTNSFRVLRQSEFTFNFSKWSSFMTLTYEPATWMFAFTLFFCCYFFFYASAAAIAIAWGIIFSSCPSVPFLWTRYLRNAWRKFHYIWHKRPLELKDELIRIWGSKVTVTSKNTFLAMTQEFLNVQLS